MKLHELYEKGQSILGQLAIEPGLPLRIRVVREKYVVMHVNKDRQGYWFIDTGFRGATRWESILGSYSEGIVDKSCLTGRYTTAYQLCQSMIIIDHEVMEKQNAQ